VTASREAPAPLSGAAEVTGDVVRRGRRLLSSTGSLDLLAALGSYVGHPVVPFALVRDTTASGTSSTRPLPTPQSRIEHHRSARLSAQLPASPVGHALQTAASRRPR
jgi:hypothetical protein